MKKRLAGTPANEDATVYIKYGWVCLVWSIYSIGALRIAGELLVDPQILHLTHNTQRTRPIRLFLPLQSFRRAPNSRRTTSKLVRTHVKDTP
jgi:hypothetical protein